MKKRMIVILTTIIFVIPLAESNEPSDLDELLQRSIAAYNQIEDYCCIFHKKERIRDDVKEVRNLVFKFKKPSSFYLKYTEGEDEGLEAIYVKGKYNDKLEIHLGGFFGFFRIGVDPLGASALKNNRHPIMEAGIGQILNLMEKYYNLAKTDPECNISIQDKVILNGEDALLIQAVFPKGKSYYGRRIIIFIHQDLSLPVKITVYGWNDELLEEYEYNDIKWNVGLTDMDFDIRNPAYRF